MGLVGELTTARSLTSSGILAPRGRGASASRPAGDPDRKLSGAGNVQRPSQATSQPQEPAEAQTRPADPAGRPKILRSRPQQLTAIPMQAQIALVVGGAVATGLLALPLKKPLGLDTTGNWSSQNLANLLVT